MEDIKNQIEEKNQKQYTPYMELRNRAIDCWNRMSQDNRTTEGAEVFGRFEAWWERQGGYQ